MFYVVVAVVMLAYVAAGVVVLRANRREMRAVDAAIAALDTLARDAGTFRPDGMRPMPRIVARMNRARYLADVEQERDRIAEYLVAVDAAHRLRGTKRGAP